MMDKNNYCDAACNKLKSYCYNGIFPSMQLITTYETGKVPIRSDRYSRLSRSTFYDMMKQNHLLASVILRNALSELCSRYNEM